ncbi:MAG: M56 family metallopeptidase [Prevotella sp.]|nr:M56 family metallopeptidase [Prevotella sp.]
MLDFLIYDIKVAVLIAVFYMFYRLMLSKETFHQVNRLVLLLTAAGSFLLPLCVITMHETVVVHTTPAVEVGELQASVVEDAVPLWQTVLPIMFIIGVIVTLARSLMSIVRVVRLIRQSERYPETDGVVICLTDSKVSPFSWMHYIVLNRQDYAEHDAAVLAHERGHIRLRHSWDVLLVDTLTAFQWFNPAMWMLRQDLRAIHEYEADGAVLSQGFNARQYQYLLITKAASIGGYSIANGISHSTLKNRIRMMLHKKSQSSHLLKLFALVPIVGVALALNAETITDYRYDEPQKKQIIKKGKRNATIKTNAVDEVVVVEAVTPQKVEPVEMPNAMKVEIKEKAFDVVEQMPQFPGGPAALMQFLSQNVKYPVEAHKAGVQGRVIANFVVEKDGNITEARIVRSVHPSLDAEALRVIGSMPNWEPGMQNGEPVRVKYTVPITFKLQGDDVKTVEEKYILEIDGKVADDTEIGSIPPGDIQSMHIEKGENGQPKKILITTKKNKE